MEEWNQKEIIIPKSLSFKSLGHDTVCSSILNNRFKVLVYIDSMGCIPCKLKLSEWKALIDTCKLKAYDVGFLFVVQSNLVKYPTIIFHPSTSPLPKRKEVRSKSIKNH